MIKQLVITDAFMKHEETYHLHPSLKAHEKDFLGMVQSWTNSKAETPLSWLASTLRTQPSALLASCVEGATEAAQCWVVSPYHARLTRSTLRVMPESMLSWSKQEALQVQDLINPLLEDEGMCLFIAGDALLLVCNRVWDVSPPAFAEVSGACLPDRLPKGEDAGKWMRLLSEVQMCLHQNPILNGEGLAIHGLWFWGQSNRTQDIKLDQMPNISTRNVYLQSVLQQLDKVRDASVIVTEAEQLNLLWNEKSLLPKSIVLMGDGRSVSLRYSAIRSLLARVFSPKWKGLERL